MITFIVGVIIILAVFKLFSKGLTHWLTDEPKNHYSKNGTWKGWKDDNDLKP